MKSVLFFLLALVAALCMPCAHAAIVRDIAYDPSIGAAGLGDLYLPQLPTSDTPVVLAIHGGGWRSGNRYSWDFWGQGFLGSDPEKSGILG